MHDLGIPRILDESWIPPSLTPSQAARLHNFIAKVRRKPNNIKADFVHSGTNSVSEHKVYKDFFPKILPKINSLLKVAMLEHGGHPQEILQTSNSDKFPIPDQLATLALVPIMISVLGDGVHNTLEEVIREKDNMRLKDICIAITACRTVYTMGGWLPGYQLEAEENINYLQSAVETALRTPEDAKTNAISSTKQNVEERVKRVCAAGQQLRIAQGDLSNKEEVTRTMAEIITHLETSFGENDVAAYALRTIDSDFCLGDDLGVKGIATKLYKELAMLLGFFDGCPASWNTYVCNNGRTAWQMVDPEEEEPIEVDNTDDEWATWQPAAEAAASSSLSSPAMPWATGQPTASLLQDFSYYAHKVYFTQIPALLMFSTMKEPTRALPLQLA
ncbi:hypothetical protein EYR38_010831 [Pleurotus pulmonarius]|nr:hypothetical protein EYR38_010831 [Pleurotus pulmonarius]